MLNTSNIYKGFFETNNFLSDKLSINRNDSNSQNIFYYGKDNSIIYKDNHIYYFKDLIECNYGINNNYELNKFNNSSNNKYKLFKTNKCVIDDVHNNNNSITKLVYELDNLNIQNN